MPGPLHEQAVEALYGRLIKSLGRKLLVTAECNECPDELSIDLLQGVAEVERNVAIGPVIPDLALLDDSGSPLTFVEVVVSHPPGRNVHRYAIEHGIQIVEFDLAAGGRPLGQTGRRRKALEEALAIKTRLRELREGQPRVDAHNLACERPRCSACGIPLPLRTVTIVTKDCWNCGKAVDVAVGSRESGHLYPAQFNASELAFAEAHGVTLEVRDSATAKEKYLANVCRACNQIQGNWFLYQDPFHDSFHLHKAERTGYDGPCDKCSERICNLHGVYRAYEADGECPTCLAQSRVTPCREREGRECYYPATCAAEGCYFTRREHARQREEQERLSKARKAEDAALKALDEEARAFEGVVQGCRSCGASRKNFRFVEGRPFCSLCGASQETEDSQTST